MPDEGFDAEKLSVLRRWGMGLQADPRSEVAAAGRAITLLIDEIERLHVLVWDRRLYPDAPAPLEPAASTPEAEEEPDEGSAAPPRRGLRGRLRHPRRRLPQADPQADLAPGAGSDDARQQPAGTESEEDAAGARDPGFGV